MKLLLEKTQQLFDMIKMLHFFIVDNLNKLLYLFVNLLLIYMRSMCFQNHCS